MIPLLTQMLFVLVVARYSKAMNTPSKGQFRWMIFKDKKVWIGVALEFNITVVGDDPRVVEVELQEAVLGYIESAKKFARGIRPAQVQTILNQKPDAAYEAQWRVARASMPKTGVPSPLSPSIYKFGIANLAAA